MSSHVSKEVCSDMWCKITVYILVYLCISPVDSQADYNCNMVNEHIHMTCIFNDNFLRLCVPLHIFTM